MGKSYKPSGLKLTRAGNYWNASWKIPAGGYGDGQQFQCKGTNGSWRSVAVTTGQTSLRFSFSQANFYPYAGKPQTASMNFRVRGNRAQFNSGGKTYNPSMSDWTLCRFGVEPPKVPSLSTEYIEWPKTKFSWSVSKNDSNAYWFTRWQYQSILLKDSNITDGAKAFAATNVGTRYAANGTVNVASGSLTIPEDSGQLSDGHSYTRWFRVRSQGPRGDSAWKYAYRVYATPGQAQITNLSVARDKSSQSFTANVKFTSPLSMKSPVSSFVVEYQFAAPAAGGTQPSDNRWETGRTVMPIATKNADGTAKDTTMGAVFSIDGTPEDDECLWIRVNTVYSDQTTTGIPHIAYAGSLATPSEMSVATPVDYVTTVTATNESAVADSFLVVRFYSDEEPQGIDIGIIPHGKTSAIVQFPEDTSPKFGVYAASPAGCYTLNADYVLTTDTTVMTGKVYYELEDGEYLEVDSPTGNPTTQGWYETTGVNRFAVDAKMTSPVLLENGAVPTAPENVSAYPATTSGTIRVTWDWSWDDADSAELSWADHEDAWESTDEPSTYTISKMRAGAWNISGLETGIKWYVRVRLISGDDESATYGAYSDTQVVDLASAPLKPVLSLTPAIIAEGEKVNASWIYSTTDGTAQAGAVLSEVTEANNEKVYTDLPIQIQTAQYVTIDTEELGWEAGEEHTLVVRVVSSSGRSSDGYSNEATVTVAEAPTCTISDTSLEDVDIDIPTDEDTTETITVTSLTEMPFTFTVTGAGTTGTTRAMIVRAASYHVDRPDETDFNGFEGETIAVMSMTGEGEMEIAQENLIGKLDDGAAYTLIATVTDGLGQTATAELDFEVHWAHQSAAPSATVEIDSENMIAVLTPSAPTGVLATDVCDIYRLSADKPVLIYEGASFGTPYVDPFPTIGDFGGHRFVTRTAEGDYIEDTAADGSFGWVDTGIDDDDNFQTRYNVIDFGAGRALLEYDASVSSSWKKDFKETAYLGGSVQGDWNKAVSRSSSVSFTAIAGKDDDLIETMRRLATYAGVCNVRTKDGSSYHANIEVNENYNYATGVKRYEYSMTINRVDPEELDGMTLAEWEALND